MDFGFLSVGNGLYLRNKWDRFMLFGECGLGGSEGKDIVTYTYELLKLGTKMLLQ